MTMLNITRKPSSSDCLIRVYATACHINRRAADLLGLDGSERGLRFVTDADELRSGRTRIYVCGCPANTRAYIPVRHGKSYRIYSTELSKALSSRLDGQGAYRICPEVSKSQDGQVYYEIFFKKIG